MSFLARVMVFLLVSSGAWSSLFDSGAEDAVWLPESSKLWAAYSPWYPVKGYVPPPSGCAISQVNIIQRHGARFPTSGAAKDILSALNKLQSVETYADPGFEFFKTFQYDLGTDDLVSFGAAQSFEAGVAAYHRYASLVNDTYLPFVRASSSARVVTSATNWTAGFANASAQIYIPKLSVILDESRNDTLDDSMCPSAGSSDAQTDEWLSVYAPNITAHLNAAAPGANLTDADAYSVMSLCPFETVAKEKASQFCALFSIEEFAGFEYYGDLDKYYNTGYGQALGPVQGVGYINELLARLTGQPVRDHTQTNSTLDSSPLTFPLNRTIYTDFSHDNQMIAIFSAMGLFNQSQPLDPRSPDESRTWLATRFVPFSSRMVVERVECGGEQYVRVLVNDDVQPLEFCGGDENSLCRLEAFVESQGYARNDGAGDFEKCFK